MQKSRQIVEGILGKSLPFQAEVHHVDEDRTNNEHTNLVVCEDQSYHYLLHRRARALKACGHANWRRCQFCGKHDAPENLYIAPDDRHSYHRVCYDKYRGRNGHIGKFITLEMAV